jgi:16S rRNA (guanine527-N7)-methyltransferase
MVPSRRLDPDELVAAGAASLGLDLDAVALDRFRRYREELSRWSAQVNLTALRRPEDIVREGFLDSLACAAFIPPSAVRAVDVGSGAGFPAIPLAIVRPALAFTLVEATRKKATFLRHIARLLQLSLTVVHARAEDLAGDPAHAGSYDVALARAVAPLPQQARLVRPLLRPGGVFLAQVGAGASDVAEAARAGFMVEREAPVAGPLPAGHAVLLLRAA